LTTSHETTLIGKDAGNAITTGHNNTCVGYQAGTSNAPGNIVTSNNQIALGNNSVATAYIKVDWTVTSDKRDKADITPFNHGLSWINKLNPVTYKWDMRTDYEDGRTPDGTHKKNQLNLGLIAQEELEVEKEHGFGDTPDNMLITHVDDGGGYGMQYSKLVPILINAVQELSAEVEQLKSQINN